MKSVLLSLAAAVLAACPAIAQMKMTVTGGKQDLTNVIIRVPAKGQAVEADTAVLPDGTALPAGFSHSELLKDGPANLFYLPKLKAGETISVSLVNKDANRKGQAFHWQGTPGEFANLFFSGRQVLQYVGVPHDTSSPDRHELTFKVFHHVYDPRDGKTLLTNGPGLAADKTQLYPHHRGLFFGFNKISYDGQQCDIWHGRNHEFQEHEKTLLKESSPLHGRQRVQIGWHGRDGKKFAEETRELTAYNLPGGTMIEFESQLTTDRPKVRLDGDPQHSGFHFRACQEVAHGTKGETYFLRPDGKGKLGETRNWDPRTKKGPVNLPWDAMSFVVAGKRYTALYLDHPDNPKEARGSEREYGRIGNYFEYDLTPEKPLKVRYRVWIQEGEMTVDQCEDLSRGFTSPPTVQ
jgi:hypothetical protein